MFDYLHSPDWAIIATTLLVGFLIVSIILAALVWRGQSRHAAAAERLLDERAAILRASEALIGNQMQQRWPALARLDPDQRQAYAERSLLAVEAMVGPWLDPEHHDLSQVARLLVQIRHDDLEQLLSLVPATNEAASETSDRTEAIETKAAAAVETTMDEKRDNRDNKERDNDVIILHDVEISKEDRH